MNTIKLTTIAALLLAGPLIAAAADKKIEAGPR
jgi:hypothetical protein